MNNSKIYVHDYRHVTLHSNEVLKIQHPMARRLSAVQKAVVKSMHELQLQRPTFWALIKQNIEIPVYYTSVLGEYHLSLATANAVNRLDFPLSPKNFQNSVNNAAIAYAHMFFELHNPYISSTHGVSSWDQNLYLIAQMIADRKIEYALMIQSHECQTSEDSVQSIAELFFLSGHSEIDGKMAKFSIENLAFKTEEQNENALVSQIQIPWLNLSDRSFPYQRNISDPYGIQMSSLWQKMGE